MATKGRNEWTEKFRKASDSDAEIQANGRHFTCSYLLDMGERRILVKVNEGKVTSLVLDPGSLEERYQFALRASPDTWRKFSQPIPEPMYHGIWAASFKRDLKLEGDLLPMMQNLRCFTRQMELLRTTGVPV